MYTYVPMNTHTVFLEMALIIASINSLPIKKIFKTNMFHLLIAIVGYFIKRKRKQTESAKSNSKENENRNLQDILILT